MTEDRESGLWRVSCCFNEAVFWEINSLLIFQLNSQMNHRIVLFMRWEYLWSPYSFIAGCETSSFEKIHFMIYKISWSCRLYLEKQTALSDPLVIYLHTYVWILQNYRILRWCLHEMFCRALRPIDCQPKEYSEEYKWKCDNRSLNVTSQRVTSLVHNSQCIMEGVLTFSDPKSCIIPYYTISQKNLKRVEPFVERNWRICQGWTNSDEKYWF